MTSIDYDLTGQRFGRLVALSYKPGTKHVPGRWKCKCDCGNVVETTGGMLRTGDKKSCGCLSIEVKANRFYKHGLTGTKMFKVWSAIKGRCLNSHDKEYKNYGGRGIGVYPGWVHDFPAFHNYILHELGPKPSQSYSLDRIDNDGNYEPGNLRWATQTMQNLNTRRSKADVIHSRQTTEAVL